MNLIKNISFEKVQEQSETSSNFQDTVSLAYNSYEFCANIY